MKNIIRVIYSCSIVLLIPLRRIGSTIKTIIKYPDIEDIGLGSWVFNSRVGKGVCLGELSLISRSEIGDYSYLRSYCAMSGRQECNIYRKASYRG